MSSDKKKTNWRWWRRWWSPIVDIETAKQATKQGFWAAVLITVVTAFLATVAVVSQKDIASINGFAYVDAVIFGVIAWRIKNYSKFFAVMGVIVFVIEKVLQSQAATQGAFGWYLAVIFLLMFINGVRGVFAYHKFSTESSPPSSSAEEIKKTTSYAITNMTHAPEIKNTGYSLSEDSSRIASPKPQSTTQQQTVVDEDRIYTMIANELETGAADNGLWTRLFAVSDGDEKKTKVLYIKQRAEKLISAERSHLEQVAHESARISARAEVNGLISTYASGDRPTAEDVAQLARSSWAEPSILALHDKLRGNTLLHWCAILGLAKEATLLITNGADASAPNGNGQRPFELAEGLALRAALRPAADIQQDDTVKPAHILKNAGPDT